MLRQLREVLAKMSSVTRQRASVSASVALHGGLLAWLLWAPSPTFIAPSFVVAGEHGTALTHLYWSGEDTGATSLKASDTRLDKARLAWKQASKKEKTHKQHATSKNAPDDNIAASRPSNAPLAGSPYGFVASGALYGQEVRPALPVVTSDPTVEPTDLAPGVEGDVIVEITIDEQGNIVQKTVLQSLGSTIDSKVLAALQNWHFRPATRDGVAIASKQDVYYHFPSRHQQLNR